MGAVYVTLTTDWMNRVYTEATARRNKAAQLGYRNHNATVLDDRRLWELELIGATGEAAVAIYCDLPWTGSNEGRYDSKIRDVEPYEVKSSDNGSDLWIRATTIQFRNPEQVFIKARIIDPDYVYLVGWSTLRDVLEYGEYREGHDCYVLAKHQLDSMDDLP
jgi:hypothetical protein